MSGSRFRRLAVVLPFTNPQSTTQPAAMTNRVSEKPKIVTGESLGLTHPHVLDFSTPNTNNPRPEAESTEPTPSSFGGGVGPGRP